VVAVGVFTRDLLYATSLTFQGKLLLNFLWVLLDHSHMAKHGGRVPLETEPQGFQNVGVIPCLLHMPEGGCVW